MFDLDPLADCVLQAAINFGKGYHAEWPLEQLNEALGLFWSNSDRVAQIYVAAYGAQVVGYMIMPARSLDQDSLNEMFVQALLAEKLVKQQEDDYEFLVPAPFVAGTYIDQEFVALVGYQEPAGLRLPTEAINYGIYMLKQQSGWPPNMHCFLYSYCVGNSPLVTGLLLAPAMDNLLDDTEADDSIFKHILEVNNPTAQSRKLRRSAENVHAMALSKFPDFDRRYF